MTEREYLTRPQGRCLVSRNIDEWTDVVIVRYDEKMVFSCGYDGLPLDDEYDFETADVDEALAWLEAKVRKYKVSADAH